MLQLSINYFNSLKMSTGFSLKQALLGGLFLFSAVSAAPIQSANLEASGTLSQRSELNERADVNGIMAGVNVIVQNSMIANVPGIVSIASKSPKQLNPDHQL